MCLGVADDHRHRHRLAERPAEAEDDRADDPRAGVRQDRVADRPPSASRRGPSIASRWLSGTAVMTSREIATIVGRIMIVRMTPALNSPIPNDGPAKNGIQPSHRMIHASTVEPQERAEDEDAPQPDDDAGDGGEQLDQEGQRDRQPGGWRARPGRSRSGARSVPRGGSRSATQQIVPTMNGSAP